jgi:predicted acyltransferase
MKQLPLDNTRVHSVDMTRGLIVALSAFLSHIPPGGYDLFRHAEWYGLTLLDFIFPAFLTIFGISVAIAYDRKIKWYKVGRRTILLILFGLLFNMIVSWNFSLSDVRYTGVLQFYAIIGLIIVLMMRLSRKWWLAALAALLLLTGYGTVLLASSEDCLNGIPQPDCNLSGVVDGMIFGEHMYAKGERGYDPEGLVTLAGATGNALLGLAGGKLLLQKRTQGASRSLMGLAIVLIMLSWMAADVLPYNKKMWTPSFALLTAGVTMFALSIFHVLIDQHKRFNLLTKGLQAFGRNSFLIYFGKYILASIMLHVTVYDLPLRDWLLGFVKEWSWAPQLTYALILFGFWLLVAIVMHRKQWYIRV